MAVGKRARPQGAVEVTLRQAYQASPTDTMQETAVFCVSVCPPVASGGRGVFLPFAPDAKGPMRHEKRVEGKFFVRFRDKRCDIKGPSPQAELRGGKAKSA